MFGWLKRKAQMKAVEMREADLLEVANEPGRVGPEQLFVLLEAASMQP